MIRAIFFYVAHVAQVAGLFCAGFIPTLGRVDSAQWGPLRTWLEGLQKNAWWLIVAASLTALFGKLFTGTIGPPWVRPALKRTLNRIRENTFTGVAGDPTYNHRVTLFRRKSCFWVTPMRHKCWPWGWGRGPWAGWMVAIARSGDTKKKTSAVFLAPEHDAENSEGIVGSVWQTREVQFQLLPELNSGSGNRAVEKYAKAAMLPVEWVRHRMEKGLPFPRLLCGIPIESNNKMWGVLVFDSTRQDTLDIEKTFQNVAKMVPAAIEELIKRM